ncbi:pirin [Spirosoma sp. HMF4905]|uniref:Pirin n=1 Tax=Spirosoma arboris TaxID=2682092 RepID=A0A7K1SIV0_9BACT|nr:pirin family protein [Spirosoma arboris]MVM33658.1 pirin [Spirosoma arboris]
MDNHTQAQLYLSDQRGCSQIDYFRSFHDFNFGSYVSEHREPFGALKLLNDDTLKAGYSISMHVEETTTVILLPIVGGLEYQSSVGTGFLEAGQTQILSLSAGMSYQISNPYETELINFIQIWLTDQSSAFTPASQQTSFNLTDKNKLLPFFSINSTANTNHGQSTGFIGTYAGREEDVYQLRKAENGIFVFILSGAFEIQNRLLHERDGLALSAIQHGEVDFEALSNDAILLLLEIPLNES